MVPPFAPDQSRAVSPVAVPGRVVAAERCHPAEQLAAPRRLGLRLSADERLLEDLVEELKRRYCRTQLVADPAIDHHE